MFIQIKARTFYMLFCACSNRKKGAFTRAVLAETSAGYRAVNKCPFFKRLMCSTLFNCRCTMHNGYV